LGSEPTGSSIDYKQNRGELPQKDRHHMTLNTTTIKNAINKVKAAKNEFVTGFTTGYDLTTGTDINSEVVASILEDTATTTVKSGNTVGILIGMLSNLMKNHTFKMIMRIIGIAGCGVSALLNMILIGTAMNFFIVVLPLLVIGTSGVLGLKGINLLISHDEVVSLWSAITLGMATGIIAGIGLLNTIGWICLGNVSMALASAALYLVPMMSYINTNK